MTRFAFRYLVGITLVFLCELGAATAQDQRLTPEPTPASWARAIVSEWTGRVRLQLPSGSFSPPTRGQTLPAGTVLDTGDGIVVLLLEDESQVLLRPGTRVLLKEPSAHDWNYLELLLGRVRAHIKKRTGGAPPFQLGTPSAVIAVRGTRFDVEANRHNVTEVDVFEGLVEVAGAGISGKSVLVGPGFSTRVALGSAPEPPTPTEEIRPDVQPPEKAMEVEFGREREIESEHAWDNERGEQPDSEANNLEQESREANEGSHDRDHDERGHSPL